MTRDVQDSEITTALRSRAAEVITEPPPVDALARRTRRAHTRQRAARWSASVLVAGVGVAVAATVTGQTADNKNAQTAGSPESPPGVSSPPSSMSASASPIGPEADILQQLEDMPVVRTYLLGDASPDALVLCGMNAVGSDSGSKMYVWLECGTYSTGPTAEQISGGADPAVVTTRRTSTGTTVTGVEFPPFGYQLSDLRSLFPDDVADTMLRGRLPVSPDEQERTEAARGTGGPSS